MINLNSEAYLPPSTPEEDRSNLNPMTAGVRMIYSNVYKWTQLREVFTPLSFPYQLQPKTVPSWSEINISEGVRGGFSDLRTKTKYLGVNVRYTQSKVN